MSCPVLRYFIGPNSKTEARRDISCGRPIWHCNAIGQLHFPCLPFSVIENTIFCENSRTSSFSNEHSACYRNLYLKVMFPEVLNKRVLVVRHHCVESELVTNGYLLCAEVWPLLLQDIMVMGRGEGKGILWISSQQLNCWLCLAVAHCSWRRIKTVHQSLVLVESNPPLLLLFFFFARLLDACFETRWGCEMLVGPLVHSTRLWSVYDLTS